MNDLLTRAQIATRFGVTQKTVTERWCKRPDFPRPARQINRLLVWWRTEDVDRWATPKA